MVTSRSSFAAVRREVSMIRAKLTRNGVVTLVFLALLSVPPLPGQSHSSTPSASENSEPTATFKASTRMVTLEVVAKDKKGNHVTGLKPSDFQIFEQSRS